MQTCLYKNTITNNHTNDSPSAISWKVGLIVECGRCISAIDLFLTAGEPF